MHRRGDPAWAVHADAGHLVATAGADVVWVVEDVPEDVVAIVQQFWSPDPPADDRLPPAARPVLEHLAALGAIAPELEHAAGGTADVVFVGDPVPGFDSLPGRGTVVVRTNAPLRELFAVADDMAAGDRPHLLCDLAFHHTVVVGPHVVPGATACLACLAGRVGARWGDPAPPPRPSATTAAALGALLAERCLASADLLSSLANATVSFDLTTLATRREPLWRSPGCATCGDWPDPGPLRLPWTERP